MLFDTLLGVVVAALVVVAVFFDMLLGGGAVDMLLGVLILECDRGLVIATPLNRSSFGYLALSKIK